jgi:hypothetical protein
MRCCRHGLYSRLCNGVPAWAQTAAPASRPAYPHTAPPRQCHATAQRSRCTM